MLGADTSLIGSLGDVPLTSRLALIGGTSSCHMMVSATPTIHAVHVSLCSVISITASY